MKVDHVGNCICLVLQLSERDAYWDTVDTRPTTRREGHCRWWSSFGEADGASE
jgi:hypothetical protein